MAGTLVIRFGALGDLCICSWFLAGLAEDPARQPLQLVTKQAYAPLARQIPGLAKVLPLEPGGPNRLWPLARALREDDPRILDAHNVIRSRLLTCLAWRRPDRRLHKDTAERRRLVHRTKRNQPVDRSLQTHLLDRLDALVEGSPGRSRLSPAVRPPLAHLGSGTKPDVIGFAPGAKWPTKRWPDHSFSALANLLLELPWLRLHIFLGPEEQAWYPNSPLAGLDPARVETIRDGDLVEVARRLAECRRVITNDSGLLHLAEAVGTPVVALFGPTVPAFGYTPLLPQSRLLDVDLSCRPCSRMGDAPCRRDDLACLVKIEPAQVRDALIESLALDTDPGETP